MSTDYSQFDQPQQFDKPPAPPTRQGSGCGKGCLIALIILGVLAILFIGGFAWMVNHIIQNTTQDPKEIASRLKEVYPTAQLPAGYSGRIALKADIWKVKLDLMVFTTDDADVEDNAEVVTGNSLLLFSFKVPGMDQEELENSMQVGNNGGTVIEKKAYKVQAGEYLFDGFLQKVQRRRNGQERRTYTQVLVPLGNDTMLVMQSDKDKVDETALRQFLQSIAKDCPTATKVEPEKGK